MNDYYLQFVLGAKNGLSEEIVQILIFVIIIVAAVIKNLFAAKHENQKQDQKNRKPAQHSQVPRKTSASAEKARLQRERLEQMLEGILQPKRGTPKRTPHGPVPTQAKPQTQAIGATPVPVKTPSGTKVYTNQSAVARTYSQTPPMASQHTSEELLETKMHDIPSIDARLEGIQQLKEEHIQEDQEHLINHQKPKKRVKISYQKSTDELFAFNDSDDLRKAIIYTEILGKPLSLREHEALYD